MTGEPAALPHQAVPKRQTFIHPPERALPIGEWPEGSQAQLPGFEAVVEGWPDNED